MMAESSPSTHRTPTQAPSYLEGAGANDLRRLRTMGAVAFPPGPGIATPWYAARYLTHRKETIDACVRRYGDVFSLWLPMYGRSVFVADPSLARDVFKANVCDIGRLAPGWS